MGHSSLLGVERADMEPIGRDVETLGPSDSSDSGSDMAGLDTTLDRNDPTEPVDVALGTDVPRTWMPVDSPDGAPTDSSGTGERRAAGNDSGGRDGADISVDRIIDPSGELDKDEDPDLAFIDEAMAEDVLDEEAEDSSELEAGDTDEPPPDETTPRTPGRRKAPKKR